MQTLQSVQIKELAREYSRRLKLQGLDSARATAIAKAIARQKITATELNAEQKRLCLFCQTCIKNAQIYYY